MDPMIDPPPACLSDMLIVGQSLNSHVLGDIKMLEADLAAAQAEREALLRIKDAADVLYSEAEEYDLPDGLGMGASQEYWDDLANALFPDDSGAVIQADLKNVQAAVDAAWEAFNEELNKPEFLPCGHHHSLMLKSAETGKPLYCELCDCISRRNDAEKMEAEHAAEVERLRGLMREAMREIGAPSVLQVMRGDDTLYGRIAAALGEG